MNVFNFRSIIIISLSILSISCSKSGGGDKAGSKSVPGIVDVQGDFSYSFKMDEQCFGSCDAFKKYERCETEQKFSSKLAYCRGLQDASLNNGCAVSKRKKQYQKDCAVDFEEINVTEMSGGTSGDDRLGGMACKWEVGDASTRKEWCDELSNEALHGYCLWDSRRITFKQEGCQGKFSDLPAELSFRDHGVRTLNSKYFKYSENNYYTYKKYRKSFKISPSSTSVFSMSDFKVTERSCEQKQLTKFKAKIIDLDSNEEALFDPKIEDMTLQGGGNYLIVFDVHNDGMCKELHWKVRIQVE